MHDLHPFSILNYFVLIWSCACLRVNYNYHSVLINSKQSCEDETVSVNNDRNSIYYTWRKTRDCVDYDLFFNSFSMLQHKNLKCYSGPQLPRQILFSRAKLTLSSLRPNLFSHGKTYFLAAKCTVLRHILLSQQLKLAAHNKNYSLTTKLKVSRGKLSLELTANLISHDKTYFLTAKPIFSRQNLTSCGKTYAFSFLAA